MIRYYHHCSSSSAYYDDCDTLHVFLVSIFATKTPTHGSVGYILPRSKVLGAVVGSNLLLSSRWLGEGPFPGKWSDYVRFGVENAGYRWIFFGGKYGK